VIALGISSAARADLPDPFQKTLYGTNFFNWVDFDEQDTAVSQPRLARINEPAGSLTAYAGEQLTHDDNVYRLPAPDITPPTSSQYSRSDFIDTTSVGADGRLSASRESVEVQARLDDYFYLHNPHLDNVGKHLQGLGNWGFTHWWSGQVGASYDQVMAQFGNYLQFGPNFGLPKDITTSRKYFASSELWLGYHWVLRANGVQRTSSDVENKFDTFTGSTGSLNLEYDADSGLVAGGTFSYTNGRYEVPAELNGFEYNRNFQERSSMGVLHLPIGDRLELHADAGYVTHDYPQASNFNFRGGIWDAALSVQTSAKTTVLLSASRRLYAQIYADSEYFVAEDLGVIARWAPTAKLTAELKFSREKQDFIGPNPEADILILPKHNTLRYREANVAWSISRALQLIVSYNFDGRHSNVPQLTYDQSLLSATLQARF
jgi:Putative beta-barrel porin 2